jgi:restriction endonuclease Mrr
MIWVFIGIGCLVIYGGMEFLMWLDKDDRKIREEKKLTEKWEKYSKRNSNKRNVQPETEEEIVLRERNERQEKKRVLGERFRKRKKEIEREQELEKERKEKEFWFGLDGLETERELNKVFEKLGYKSELTPIGGDEGLDHILDDEIVVQTKNQKRKTSRPDLQKFRGSMKDYEKGIFVSINGFTHTCEKFVQTSDRQILLYDVNDVIGMSEGRKPEWNENEE